MKFLHLMPYSPIPREFGGAIRTYHMLKNIAKHHEVTVVTFGWPEDYYNLRHEFNSHLAEIHLVPKNWSLPLRRMVQLYSHFRSHSFFYYLLKSNRLQELLDRLLDRNTYDVIQMEFAQMGVFELRSDAIKILDAHNVEYDNFRRIAEHADSRIKKFHYLVEHRKFFQEEVDVCSKMDAIFVTSTRDKEILDRDVAGIPKYVLPNGVDTRYFDQSEEVSEPHTLTFTGLMSYIPNHDGIMWFLDQCFPIVRKRFPDVKLYVVGSQPGKTLVRRSDANVVVTGRVPDVRPYIAKAGVFIVPLRMGGGTRLKVVEALAMRKPIVSTSIGCEGIDVQHRTTALIEDDPAGFAESIIELFQSDDLRRKLAANGRQLVKQCYDWDVVARKQEEYYQKICRAAKRTKPVHRHATLAGMELGRREEYYGKC